MLGPPASFLIACWCLLTWPAQSSAMVFWFDDRVPIDKVSQRERDELLGMSGGIFCTDGTTGSGFLADVSGYLAEGEKVPILVSTSRILLDQATGYNRAICAFRPAGAPDRLVTIGERLAGWAQVGHMDRNDWVFAKLEDSAGLTRGLVLDFTAAEEMAQARKIPLWTAGYDKKFSNVALTSGCHMVRFNADPSAILDTGPLPFIIHNCDLHAEANGGPIAVEVEGRFRVVGINVGDSQEETFPDMSYLPFDLSRRFFNFGRRLDPDMENKLVAFLSRFAELRRPSAAIQARKVLIRAVQANLLRLGYELGPADGLMGQRTREAVSAFQTSLGINPTGQVSEELLLLLQAR